MQRKLNNTLDDIAAQAVNAKDQLQVSVVGMGDGTDADFPAIYADLFGERTFINSNGGWDYEYFTSYALPDFVGGAGALTSTKGDQPLAFCPILGSVPASSRSMLLRWRHSTIRLATNATTT